MGGFGIGAITTLILVNGAPGVGKSTLARRYVDDHPLALLLDIDAIRTSMGGWREHAESMRLARELALVLAEAHLGSGHDIVVPQYVGRPELIDALGAAAERRGAVFVQILLAVDQEVLAQRFRARRASLLDQGGLHPEADVADSAVESMISAADANLASIAAERRSLVPISAAGTPDETYLALMTVIEAVERRQPVGERPTD